MKINEVVTLHPSVAAKSEFDMLLRAGESSAEEIVEFIMDDRNPERRRLAMLRHLDNVLGDPKDAPYDTTDLEDFMHNQGAPTPEEENEIARDMKLPPYHLSVVDETEDDEIPTGEYEVCERCGGEGCIECEEGLKDITGMHRIPDFSDYKGE